MDWRFLSANPSLLYSYLLLLTGPTFSFACETHNFPAYQNWRHLSLANLQNSGSSGAVCVVLSASSIQEVIEISIRNVDKRRDDSAECRSQNILEIRDGSFTVSPLLRMVCGEGVSMTTITSSGSVLFLHLHSEPNSKPDPVSFDVAYKSKPKDLTTLSPDTFMPTSFSGCLHYEKLRVSETAAVLTSANYPIGYNGSQEVCWILDSRQWPGSRVAIRVFDSDLESTMDQDTQDIASSSLDPICPDSEDFVEAYNGWSVDHTAYIQRWCEQMIPEPFQSSGSILLIRFKTVFHSTRTKNRGFKLQYWSSYDFPNGDQYRQRTGYYISGGRIAIALAVLAIILVSGGIFRRRQIYLRARAMRTGSSRRRSQVAAAHNVVGRTDNTGRNQHRRGQCARIDVTSLPVYAIGSPNYSELPPPGFNTDPSAYGAFPKPPPYPGTMDLAGAPPAYEDIIGNKDTVLESSYPNVHDKEDESSTTVCAEGSTVNTSEQQNRDYNAQIPAEESGTREYNEQSPAANSRIEGDNT